MFIPDNCFGLVCLFKKKWPLNSFELSLYFCIPGRLSQTIIFDLCMYLNLKKWPLNSFELSLYLLFSWTFIPDDYFDFCMYLKKKRPLNSVELSLYLFCLFLKDYPRLVLLDKLIKNDPWTFVSHVISF